MDNKVVIEIICPKCSKKALFQSMLIGSYKLYPDKNGKVSCTNCGFNSTHIFSGKDYFYKIEIDNRILYAQTREKLISLRDYFKNSSQKGNIGPDMDFPKVFYTHKGEIIKKIDAILESH
ncbi:MAG: hypothetical protein K0S32_3985 [Bacteroidetes bacterium]|nr:hypothetical protein [Bacteroidota bacterium]